MAWLFTEYDVERNSQVLHWTFSIARATSYSVNRQATLGLYFSWLSKGKGNSFIFNVDESPVWKVLAKTMVGFTFPARHSLG